MTKHPLVVVESPFAGDRVLHDAYLRACLRDSMKRGEYPFASHAIYPLILDDDIPGDRAAGIHAGFAWGEHAQLTAVYGDLGVSKGMWQGMLAAQKAGRPIDLRTLGERWAR